MWIAGEEPCPYPCETKAPDLSGAPGYAILACMAFLLCWYVKILVTGR